MIKRLSTCSTHSCTCHASAASDIPDDLADFGKFTAKFVCHDKLGQADFPPSTGQYDVVTCMFAIHYFFHTEATAHQFLRNVAHNLKPGMSLMYYCIQGVQHWLPPQCTSTSPPACVLRTHSAWMTCCLLRTSTYQRPLGTAAAEQLCVQAATSWAQCLAGAE